jgi:selenocysteine lyase/cysteine desulfurase
MYAHRLCKAMGIDPDDGVVRVSLVHYNTLDEIDGLIGVLEEVL